MITNNGATNAIEVASAIGIVFKPKRKVTADPACANPRSNCLEKFCVFPNHLKLYSITKFTPKNKPNILIKTTCTGG